jgi:hypothetical protein
VAWSAVGVPDGGDGDIRTGVNFYWTEVFGGTHGRAEVFYWHLPLTDQHLLDTRAPEELFLYPEDFDQLPNDIQDGETSWTVLDQPED